MRNLGWLRTGCHPIISILDTGYVTFFYYFVLQMLKIEATLKIKKNQAIMYWIIVVKANSRNSASSNTEQEWKASHVLFTRSPRYSELKHVSIEKDLEAQAKREHVKRFFSTGRDFIVNTHQKSVFYMFDNHY